MLSVAVLYSLFFLPAAVFAAFGYTDDGSNYVIDSGADLAIAVSKCCGDMVSLKFKGVEYQGYNGKNTQVRATGARRPPQLHSFMDLTVALDKLRSA